MLQSPALRCRAVRVHTMTIGFAVRLGQCNLINDDKLHWATLQPAVCPPLTHMHRQGFDEQLQQR